MRRSLELIGLAAVLVAASASVYLAWRVNAVNQPQTVTWEVAPGVSIVIVAPSTSMTPDQFGAYCKSYIAAFKRGVGE